MDRRDLLKSVLAIPGIASIERIELKPDEVDVNLVVKNWHDAFEHFRLKPPPCLVFPSGWSLKVAKLT